MYINNLVQDKNDLINILEPISNVTNGYTFTQAIPEIINANFS